jgi:predicted nucleic acid-binding protein
MAEKLWVLDTSVVLGWFFTDEPKRYEALAVRRRMRDDPAPFVVPPPFHSELVHVLRESLAATRASLCRPSD